MTIKPFILMKVVIFFTCMALEVINASSVTNLFLMFSRIGILDKACLCYYKSCVLPRGTMYFK